MEESENYSLHTFTGKHVTVRDFSRMSFPLLGISSMTKDHIAAEFDRVLEILSICSEWEVKELASVVGTLLTDSVQPNK